MMQLKAIFSVLLRRYTFEMAQAPESYRNDHSKMVVQLRQPCRVRYRRRQADTAGPKRTGQQTRSRGKRARIGVDLDLCQGHGVCISELPGSSPSTKPRDRSESSRGKSPRASACALKMPCAIARPGRCFSKKTTTSKRLHPRTRSHHALLSRQELDEMMRRWVAANDDAGETGDWSAMANFYTGDAVYSWNNGSKYEFVARNRDEIRDWVFGTEMDGLGKWTYPYVRVLVDEKQGEVVGFWRQVAPIERPDGSVYEIAGTGGSWFRYAGDYQWSWQRDFFDHANAGAIFGELLKNEQLPAPCRSE